MLQTIQNAGESFTKIILPQVKSLSTLCCGIAAHDTVPSTDCDMIERLLKNTQQLTHKDIERLKEFRFPFRHLILSGGSSNGVAFVGAYKALYNVGIISQITHIAGCSTGAVSSIFFVLKLPESQVIEEIMNFNMNECLDFSHCVLVDAYRVLFEWGLCHGDVLEQWIEKILQKYTHKRNITFEQLYKHTKVHLKIVVFNHSLEKTEYWDHITQPQQIVSLAVRVSASVPWLFKPKTVNGCLYIDGGFGSYFPLTVFDEKPLDPKTFGLILCDKEPKPKQNIDNILDQFVDLHNSMSTALFNWEHANDDWKGRSCVVPNPGKAIYDFVFTQRSKLDHIALAYEGTLQNLKYYTQHKHFPRTHLSNVLN